MLNLSALAERTQVGLAKKGSTKKGRQQNTIGDVIVVASGLKE